VLALIVALVLAAAAVALSRGDDQNAMEAESGPKAPKPDLVRPLPPSPYEVPAGALRVTTSAQLEKALRRTRPTTIVLADGVYGGTEPFLNPHSHRLYARRLGGAVLRVGLSLGGNDGRPGGLVRGLVFDVRDPAKTADGAEIMVWGTATRARVLDVSLHGNGVVPSGLVVREPEGFVAARLVVRQFTDYGVLVDANDPARTKLDRRFRLADVNVAEVARPLQGSSDGRAEACVWVGNPGVVERVRARRCAWTGLWTGTATSGAVFDRIDVDRTPTGVYVEHFTRSSRFRRLEIGAEVRIGLLTEWADPASGGRAASVDNVIEDSWFASRLAGVYLDAGTTRTTVRRSTFVNQRWAAIGDYQGIDNTYYRNDYEGIARDAAEVSDEHVSVFEEAGR
jgi:hypothetical protein